MEKSLMIATDANTSRVFAERADGLRIPVLVPIRHSPESIALYMGGNDVGGIVVASHLEDGMEVDASHIHGWREATRALLHVCVNIRPSSEVRKRQQYFLSIGADSVVAFDAAMAPADESAVRFALERMKEHLLQQ